MQKRTFKIVTDEEKKQCLEFAQNCVSTNYQEYSRRNQSDEQKIIDDIRIGKICECMVTRYFTLKGKPCSSPDFAIYGKEKKSFDSDIVVFDTDTKIHVKSCRSDSPFPISWVFQPNDPLIIAPEENDYIALCVYGSDSYWYLIPASEANYEAPMKKSLNKKVIYERSLP